MGYFEVFAAALAAFYSVVPSLGLAIILLTLVTRILLLPLSIKQTRSMREMQKIQPEVKKIQAKNKGDRQKMNEEMMALYKEHGVNPFGGCLPLVMQFPVLIGLFYVIRSPEAYLSSGAALLKDLGAAPERVYDFLGVLDLNRGAGEILAGGFAENLVTALPYLVLIGVMGFTTYYQQKQMQGSRGAGDAQAQQMQMFGKIMPVILIVFGFQFPAGVVLYWVTTNLWTVAQQRLILGHLGPAPAIETKAKSKAADKADKPSRTGKTNKRSEAGKSPDGAAGKQKQSGAGSAGKQEQSRAGSAGPQEQDVAKSVTKRSGKSPTTAKPTGNGRPARPAARSGSKKRKR